MWAKLYNERYGGWALVGAIILIWLVVLALFRFYGYEQTWHLWKVPTETPPFLDFRLIPGSATSFRNGFEPTINNPFDPGKRIFNYPAFWRLFFYTGITLDDTIWISIIMLILYFIAVLSFPQKISVLDTFWILLIVFSPASMLLYERGNVDLIVFIICVLIILAAGYSTYLTAGLLVFGMVVKMFPLFGVTVLLKDSKRRFILLTIGCVLLTLAYVAATFKSEAAAWNYTMRGNGLSYGAFVIITRLNEYFQIAFPNLFSFNQWKVLFEIIAFGLILVAGILAIREPDSLGTSHERNLTAFRMGAAIYVGTFLLGNNWDYRLAFLVLIVPQLSQWFRQEYKIYKYISIGTMIVIVLTCWYLWLNFDLPFLPFKDPVNRKFIIDEFLNWLLVPGFTYLLVASFPDWLRSDLQKVFGVIKRKQHESKSSPRFA